MVIEKNKIIFSDPLEKHIIYWALVDYSLTETNNDKVLASRNILYALKKHIREKGLKVL